MTITREQVFGSIDFRTIAQNPDFKEDSVRELIILPLLQQLGYGLPHIVRSKSLKHPFLRIGSNKNRPITLVPDYLLRIADSYAWVLDAKAPNQQLNNTHHIEQVYSYATHPEIRSTYFALCNGLEFSLYRREHTNTPILYFTLDEIECHWDSLLQYLSPNSFQDGKNYTYQSTPTPTPKHAFDYATRPLLEEIVVKKQQAKRHFGVHGYFTKQSWNVVAEYIKNFSQPNDIVLDPFGGSGVTAIEALMNNRQAINVDLNPMAIFLVQSLAAPIKTAALAKAFESIKKEYLQHQPTTTQQIAQALQQYPQPAALPLPKGSDVASVDQLFSPKQLAELSLLKHLIVKQKDPNIKHTLLLMFSGLVSKINLIYHQSSNRSEGRGNASVFQYYRYRLASEPVELDVVKYFTSRYKKVLEAKREMEYFK